MRLIVETINFWQSVTTPLKHTVCYISPLLYYSCGQFKLRFTPGCWPTWSILGDFTRLAVQWFTILKLLHVFQVAPNGPRGEIDTNNFLQSSGNVLAGASSKCASKKTNDLVQSAAKFPSKSALLAALQGKSSVFAVPSCNPPGPLLLLLKHKTDALTFFLFHSQIKNGFNDFWRYRFAGGHFETKCRRKTVLKCWRAKKQNTGQRSCPK